MYCIYNIRKITLSGNAKRDRKNIFHSADGSKDRRFCEEKNQFSRQMHLVYCSQRGTNSLALSRLNFVKPSLFTWFSFSDDSFLSFNAPPSAPLPAPWRSTQVDRETEVESMKEERQSIVRNALPRQRCVECPSVFLTVSRKGHRKFRCPDWK